MITLAFVTGTEPSKWFRRYREGTVHRLEARDADDAFGAVLSGEADIALARLPDERITDDFHLVRLYEEELGVAVPKDSVYAEVGEAVERVELDDEHVNEWATIDELRSALQVVAANVGIAYGPKPLLKVLSKKQVVPLSVRGGLGATIEIALVWPKDKDSDAIQDFVGVAKGRTPRSSRAAAPKRTAKEKAAAKQARRGGGNTRKRGKPRRT